MDESDWYSPMVNDVRLAPLPIASTALAGWGASRACGKRSSSGGDVRNPQKKG